ncbi:PIN domain-containing protein [Pseudonocardia xinjiangensis]|uniref:Type II toxin-antitoxin system VapC family toxin n=1 Tax=Pseudonocardia xinjiangensis TaxID=75289 RepID=A0ABX1RK73_9PSEU|nr:PIN domain-containing protein [Pseudonocardia xinjiangensis]NMH80773.1 type II toxin-antitoxin system VapC family toxin [Pseudonocardia xinjiangensis]
MSRGILDTSILIDTDVSPIPGELAISTISIAELQFGVLVAPEHARAARLFRLSAIQRRFDPLPVDDAVSDSYAQLAARVTAVGRQPRARVMDLLIAATAHAHNATIYTRNPKDLAGLEDLVTIAVV